MRTLRATRIVRGRPPQVRGSLGGNAGGGVPVPSKLVTITGVSATGAAGTVTTTTS